MRIYLEAIEIPPEEAPADYTPEFIRLDATGKNEADVLRDLKMLLNPEKHYVVQKHYCYHDEGKPCRVEVIERT